MKPTTLLLKFLLSGRPFKEDNFEKGKGKKTIAIKWWVYETKTSYIGKVTWFLEEGIKQMKKDFSI